MPELLRPSREIYIAGKVDASEVSIADLALELENRGHRIREKWWTKGRLPRPYLDHLDTSTPAADAMIDAAYRSDVFILFPTDDIMGAVGEFGAALASTKARPDKQVLVVNPFEVRQSVFYAHSRVRRLLAVTALRGEPWY